MRAPAFLAPASRTLGILASEKINGFLVLLLLSFYCQFAIDRSEVQREVRPRPAHNGDGLYDLTKHRDSPATHSSGPAAGLLQQGAAKAPPTQCRGGQSSEMNFSLYGYPPYHPMYISHEKLNQALTSPAKDEVPRASRHVPAMPLDATADDGPGKPTSVIVEHRTPRHQQVAPISVDPYRCRGSITHGTAAGVKPISTATALRQGTVPAATPLTTRDEAPWTKKPTCVVNGLCWTGSQTVPSVGRPLSPPSKVDLISQGLVPNPLYSSAAVGVHRGVAEVLPKLAVAGVDYAVDMSAKRTAVQARCEAPMKRIRCDDPPPSPWPPQGQSQAAPPPPGSSYMDSFKSFVDHAVQSAFMDETERDAVARSDPTRPITVGSILRSLTTPPKSQPRSLPPVTSDYPPSSQSDQAGTEPGAWTSGSAVLYEKLAVSSGVQSLSSPSQMPSLVASVGAGPTSTSPAAVNNGPPLLMPQCPLESVHEPPVTNSPASSTAAISDRAPCRGAGADTDSETLSAHSPAPVLVPAASTSPPVSACSSSLHLKKTWLLRYSDEDRKNAAVDSSPPSASYEKSQDAPLSTDDKPTDAWSAKPKPMTGKPEESVSESDTKPSKTSEKPRPEQDRKGANKAADVEDDKTTTTDGKESIKNCFINCTYLSDKPPRRIVKDSADARSNTSKESDDSQVSDPEPTSRRIITTHRCAVRVSDNNNSEIISTDSNNTVRSVVKK